jgi:hypothetical protein
MHTENQHTKSRLVDEHATHGLQPAAAGKCNIHDDDGWFYRRGELACSRGVGGFSHDLDALIAFEKASVSLAHDRVIIDE